MHSLQMCSEHKKRDNGYDIYDRYDRYDRYDKIMEWS